MKQRTAFKLPQREYLREWFDKYKYLLLLCIVGLIFLMWPGSKESKADERKDTVIQAEDSVEALQKQMEELFAQISGVGKVRVLLTVKSSKESIYAYNTDSSSAYGENETDESFRSELITVGSGTGETPVITKICMPEFLGAVVVCEGADSAKICLQLTEAVSSLTGITADHIVISKMQK